MTFSIVAFDPETKDLGVAVESKFPVVGAVVPWARAGVGAVATQADANTTYGPRGMSLLRRGRTPRQAIAELVHGDQDRDVRQVGIVDTRGRSASFTGVACRPWAGHVLGRHYAAQGNILAGEDVVRSMARTYETADGDLPLKILAALEAGQEAGGDRRGQQSAALLVVRAKGGYDGHTDRWIDLRVDDHAAPIRELRRVFEVYDATLLTRESEAEAVPITADTARWIQEFLTRAGVYGGPITGTWDRRTEGAFERYLGGENLETKVRKDGRIWGSVWRYLHTKAETK